MSHLKLVVALCDCGLCLFTGDDMDEILKSLAKKQSRWGVSLASSYVKHFSGIEGFDELLKNAETQLTYCNDRMTVKAFDAKDVPESAIMAIRAVYTTTRKDRDGDILESTGCVVDPKMPVLWQHLQHQPIGAHVKETGRGRNYVSGMMVLADTPLARDAAKLVEVGGLRISHGFEPIEYTALYNDEKQREGWHFKRWSMMEVSLVSMPSNVEAVITDTQKLKSWEKNYDALLTLCSRDRLESEEVKALGKKCMELRPVQGVGADFTPEVPVKAVKPEDEEPEDDEEDDGENPADEPADDEVDASDEDLAVNEMQDDEKTICSKSMGCMTKAMSYEMCDDAKSYCQRSYDGMKMLETKLRNYDQNVQRSFMAELVKNPSKLEEVHGILSKLVDANRAIEVARSLGVVGR